jgi:hypothetical protein
VCVAVEDGDSHVVGNSCASVGCVGVQSVVGKSAGWLEQAIVASGDVCLNRTKEVSFD